MEIVTKIIDNIDVLVIGGGIAGTFASIKAKEAGAKKVVQVDKSHVGKSGNSAFGAGVLHVWLPEEGDEGLEDRFRRLSRAQGYLVQQDLIRDHLEQSWEIVKDMEQYGVEFERKEGGEIESHAGRGAHPIIMFHGPQMMDSLMRASLRKGVQHVNRVMVTDLVNVNGKIAGAVGFNTQTGDFHVFKSKSTVIATGSTWYKGLLPGHRDDTGDGYGMAFRAGATLWGSENNDQISHAMPARFDIGPGLNMFQGLGGKWINRNGERFMEKYNPSLMERAGLRNIMYGFILEIKQGNGPIEMDMTHFTTAQIERMRKVIPLPTLQFERAGLIAQNRFVKPVEWMLCPPTGRPGLAVNRSFETSLEGLYACGEAASSAAVVTGLASAATSGAVAAKTAAEYAKSSSISEISNEVLHDLQQRTLGPLEKLHGVEPDLLVVSIQENVIPYDIVLLRNEERLTNALENLEFLRDNYLNEMKAYDPHYLRKVHEAHNMLFTAEAQLKTCLLRKESRVGLREDYPFTDNENWFKWITITNAAGTMEMGTAEVPIGTYPMKVEHVSELHYIWQLAQSLGIMHIEGGKVVWA
jgi:succinate dehydrogenase/fumarate reductase flavoprotein subunit